MIPCQLAQLIDFKETLLSLFAHHVRPQPARSHAALRTLPVPGPDQGTDGRIRGEFVAMGLGFCTSSN